MKFKINIIVSDVIMKQYQLDIYGNLVDIDMIVKSKKCNEKYKRKVLKDRKDFYKKGILRDVSKTSR